MVLLILAFKIISVIGTIHLSKQPSDQRDSDNWGYSTCFKILTLGGLAKYVAKGIILNLQWIYNSMTTQRNGCVKHSSVLHIVYYCVRTAIFINMLDFWMKKFTILLMHLIGWVSKCNCLAKVFYRLGQELNLLFLKLLDNIQACRVTFHFHVLMVH